MKRNVQSIKRSSWCPMPRLLALLMLASTASGCGLLSRDPVVVTQFVDRECPRPPEVQLDHPLPTGYFSIRLLEIFKNLPGEPTE